MSPSGRALRSRGVEDERRHAHVRVADGRQVVGVERRHGEGEGHPGTEPGHLVAPRLEQRGECRLVGGEALRRRDVVVHEHEGLAAAGEEPVHRVVADRRVVDDGRRRLGRGGRRSTGSSCTSSAILGSTCGAKISDGPRRPQQVAQLEGERGDGVARGRRREHLVGGQLADTPRRRSPAGANSSRLILTMLAAATGPALGPGPGPRPRRVAMRHSRRDVGQARLLHEEPEVRRVDRVGVGRVEVEGMGERVQRLRVDRLDRAASRPAAPCPWRW